MSREIEKIIAFSFISRALQALQLHFEAFHAAAAADDHHPAHGYADALKNFIVLETLF